MANSLHVVYIGEKYGHTNGETLKQRGRSTEIIHHVFRCIPGKSTVGMVAFNTVGPSPLFRFASLTHDGLIDPL